MSIGVGTWAFSALKFQADMGILLAFMFLVNMLGAIFLLPAMAYWLNVGAAEARARIKRLHRQPMTCVRQRRRHQPRRRHAQTRTPVIRERQSVMQTAASTLEQVLLNMLWPRP
jgi:hypothetical protein